ncbi:MAG: hypothetical protein ACTHK7_21635, partial [Aureliella sp.]
MSSSVEAELIALCPKGKTSWGWVYHGDQKIHNVRIEHDGERITTIKFDGDFEPSVVCKEVVAAFHMVREQRSRSAKKAAATRARRQAL